jgi:hypothetical protein
MIILEEHVVASRFDGVNCHYVVEQGGKRWTVTVPRAELDGYGLGDGHKAARRAHLTRAIAAAMKGPPDPEPPQEESQ